MTEDINLRFSHLKEKMVDPKFQHNEGLSNEVGYWIFDYPADQELEVRKQIAKISDSPLASRVNLRVFDIYDVMMKLLREQEEYTGADPIPILENIEKKQGFDVLIEQINNILEMSENNNLIVQYIQSRLPEQCIIFLDGLGKVYPIIRAHKILNTMHQVLDKNPVVMFYPGNYDEMSLRAFGEVKDQNYYRAFRVD
ncbi:MULTISPECIES: DUF1788 domain-containing protein [Lactobacillus]|uniref:DUF1788 domain-containing protein n=1 Tax=Ligilactobacillus salivarius TaxID=1624 RepID=A0A921IE85_9LACO|nr:MULTISPECIES: DUF1788 domain-containing protein [Lactobacillus]HJG15198.1 DUF1788 domain-containing protein [Ligilactobacillus salivarius]MBE5058121.1 DUF1788 domain-containing protein [Lactobacillus crispatus]MCT7690481.1 DUF1788 domain-containing protein [Lactobacillus crispatus]MCT7699313.1 DUF1788 domain-containing protein [Lactobacillus crispatus]MCT7790340.1 DUF1788 domain-containing protein [Lactobacillus crispatus]